MAFANIAVCLFSEETVPWKLRGRGNVKGTLNLFFFSIKTPQLISPINKLKETVSPEMRARQAHRDLYLV